MLNGAAFGTHTSLPEHPPPTLPVSAHVRPSKPYEMAGLFIVGAGEQLPPDGVGAVAFTDQLSELIAGERA
jgi:hypothetical protein